MPKTVPNRLILLREALKLTQTQVARLSGISRSAITKMEGGEQKPSIELLLFYRDTFGVSIDWFYDESLKLDIDNVFMKLKELNIKTPDEVKIIEEISLKNLHNPLSHETSKLFPFLDLSSRPLVAVTGKVSPQTLKSFLVAYSNTPLFSNCIVVEVGADLMEPRLKSGDKVLCRPVEVSEWDYVNSDVFVVLYRDTFTIKRILKNDLTLNNTLTLHPDNRELGASLTINREDIKAVWRVLKIVDSAGV